MSCRIWSDDWVVVGEELERDKHATRLGYTPLFVFASGETSVQPTANETGKIRSITLIIHYSVVAKMSRQELHVKRQPEPKTERKVPYK